MCDECARLRTIYTETAERLNTAQRELARYGISSRAKDFARLWTESETALKALWALREEMAKHSATHGEGALSARG
jgi:hypothetical protein